MSYTKEDFIKDYELWLSRPENGKYRSWNDELCKFGFEVTVPLLPRRINENVFINEILVAQLIEYLYTGNFSVHGDNGYDIFSLRAKLTPDGVMFTYSSSFIDEIYVTNYGFAESQEEVDGYVEKIRAYLEDHADFFGKSFDVSQNNTNVVFALTTNSLYSECAVIEPFIRLAVMLDFECRRRFPFHDIADYEKIYNFVDDVEHFQRVVNYSNARESSISKLIGSSYKQTHSELVARVEGLFERFAQDEKVSELLLTILDGLKNTTPEEFEQIKKAIFDL